MDLYIFFLVLSFFCVFTQIIMSVIWLRKNGDGSNSMRLLKSSKVGQFLKIIRIVFLISTLLALYFYLKGGK